MEKITLTKFDGTDFNVWKFQIQSWLDVHGLLEVVDGTWPKPPQQKEDAVSEWLKLDKKARMVIGYALEKNIVPKVMNLKTSHEMWTRLLTIYEMKNEASVHMLMQQFFEYKMGKNTSISQHVAQIEQMAQRLEDLGHKQEDLAIITKTLMSLPQAYQQFIVAWDSLDKKEQTKENLLPRLLKQELLINGMSKSTENENVAFIHSASSGEQNSQKNKSAKTFKKFSGKCHYCHKTGHKRSDCFKRKNEQKAGEANSATSSKIEGAYMFTALTAGVPCENEKFYADSGASHHMTARREWFENYVEWPRNEQKTITIGDGKQLIAVGMGSINIESDVNGVIKRHKLTNVLHVPQIDRNLFSLGRGQDNGATSVMNKDNIKMFFEGKQIAYAIRDTNGLYEMNFRVISAGCASAHVASATEATIERWHERFGHANFKSINELAIGNIVTGMVICGKEKLKYNENNFCENCVVGKHHRKPFTESKMRAKVCGELIHFDLVGPMSEQSYGGANHLAVFTDDYSGMVVVTPIKQKSDIVECIELLITEYKAAGHSVLRMRSDNAKEFTGQDMVAVMRKYSVKHEYSTPYVPQQNGRSERQNRTIIEMARTMLNAASLPTRLWGEACRTAAHIRNLIPLKRLDGKTPSEVFHRKKPDVSYLRVYGSECYVYVEKHRRNKFDAKSKKMVLVGYERGSKAYRLWERGTRRVIVSRDVHIVEPPPGVIMLTMTNNEKNKESHEQKEVIEDNKSKLDSEYEDNDEKATVDELIPSTAREEAIARRTRSQTQENKTQRNDNFANIGYLYTATVTPVNVKQARESPDREQWENAMQDEISALKENKTWVLVDRPEKRKIINNRWVFRVKVKPNGEVDRYRARLVVKGCAQVAGLDYNETFSPVTRFESVRTLMSIAAVEDFDIYQMDVKCAFLYGSLDEEIYMEQVDGFEDGTDRVCLLKKSLYGLKQAPRQFHKKIDTELESLGLKKTNADPCVYTSSNGNLYLALYIDDGLVIGSSQKEIEKLLRALKEKFKITWEVANCYLGVEIARNREAKTILLHQTAYARSILERFKMMDSNPNATPADTKIKLTKNVNSDGTVGVIANVPYREAIGSLMYLAIGTRPDLAFIVSQLSQFLDAPSESHWTAVKRVFRYIKGTLNKGIVYGGKTDVKNEIRAYSDADWATSVDDRKSISGVVLIINNAPVIWKSQKQSIVTDSTMYAEYVAAHIAAKNVKWLRLLMKELGHEQLTSTKLFIDNTAAEQLCKNPVYHDRSKHVDIKYHFIRDRIKEGEIEVLRVATYGQLADLLTKSLSRGKLLVNCNALNLI